MNQKFKWDEFYWVTDLMLPSWGEGMHNGNLTLVFAPEGRGNEPLNDHELKLVNWILENEKEVQEAFIQKLLSTYPQFQSVNDLKKNISVTTINIHPFLNSERPYYGIEFSCTWDQEHGLGVLMHGIEVLEIGNADTAIYLWIAKKYVE